MGAASLGDMWARSVCPSSFLIGWVPPLVSVLGLPQHCSFHGLRWHLIVVCSCACCDAEAAVVPLALQIWLLWVLDHRCSIRMKAQRRTLFCRCRDEPQEEEEGRQVCFIEGAGDGQAGSAGDCFCSSTGHR